MKPARRALEGSVRAPPSKSYTHRALLMAFLAGDARVRGPLWGADTLATRACLRTLGARMDGERAVRVRRGELRPPDDVLDVENSGTTLRLLSGVCGLLDGASVLTGDASIRARPMQPLLGALRDLGCDAFSTRGDGRAPVVVRGPMRGGEARLPGDVSSQFVSSLLMACPLAAGDTRVALTSPLKSRPYVDVTLAMLRHFGVRVEPVGGVAMARGAGRRSAAMPRSGDASSEGVRGHEERGGGAAAEPRSGDASSEGVRGHEERGGGAAAEPRSDDVPRGFDVPGGQRYRRRDFAVPGDYSSAAFPLVAGAITGGEVTVTGLAPEWPQGDRFILDALRAMGAEVRERGGCATVRGGELRGADLDLGDTPDLFPVLCVAAACARGTTTLRGAPQLRFKESDRIRAMARGLRAMGARCAERPDGLVVRGPAKLRGARIRTGGDHRILMSFAVAALRASGPVHLDEHDSFTVSYPAFLDHLRALGVQAVVR